MNIIIRNNNCKQKKYIRKTEEDEPELELN